MKKAHVFKYSQVILTERRLAIIEFSECSGLTTQTIASIAITQEKSDGIIDQYKTGKLNTEEFCTKMNKLISDAGSKPIVDNKIFDNCWNSMCVVEPEKLAKLHDLQQKYNFHIHIIGGTNELQHSYIQQIIQSLTKKPDISYTLSYEEHTLDMNELMGAAEDFLKAQDFEPIWHMQEQNNYEQNALTILGDYYS